MSDREEIETAVAQFRAAYEAGDLRALSDCYSASLLKLRQGGEPETKDEAIRRIGQVLAESTGALEVWNDELEVSGALAFIRGRFVVTLTPREGGTALVVQRRFLEIWKKEDGTWRVYRTMDNTD